MSQKKNLRINILPEGENCPASQGANLLESLNEADIEINQSCGGNGTCGTCVFTLLSGNALLRNEIEQEMATDRDFAENERLACQFEISSDLEIEIKTT